LSHQTLTIARLFLQQIATATRPFRPGSSDEFAQSLPRSPLSRLTNVSLSLPNRAMNLSRTRDRRELPTESSFPRISSPHRISTPFRPLSSREPLACVPSQPGRSRYQSISLRRLPFRAPSGF